MSVNVYKIECLTNLHVGSGDVNYNIIDNEVERDVVTGYPVIHASGLKGALREYCKNNTTFPCTCKNQDQCPKEEQCKGQDQCPVKEQCKDRGQCPLKKDGKDEKACPFAISYIFGQESGSNDLQAGAYKFLDANLIARPMRVSGGNSDKPWIPVVSVGSVNGFIEKLNAFGCKDFGKDLISIDFGASNFFSNVGNISVEGEKAGDINRLPEKAKSVLDNLKSIIGDKYAIAKDFDNYDLPVIARNHLENGISKNLWYEEVVPHHSVFYTIIITPDDKDKLMLDGKIVQIGGHASIGCGFTRFTKL